MNIYDDTTITRDGAVLLEFQEPDQINGSPNITAFSTAQQANQNLDPDPNSKTSSNSIFSLSYYQEFFNVNTDEVITKVRYSLIPNMSVNYFDQFIKSKADLYGPVWICVTLAFSIAIGSNLLDYLSTSDSHWKYEFHLITKASLIVFLYAWIIPLILWSLIKWYLASQMFVSVIELISVYGYCLVSYIPLSLFWIIPFHAVQWILLVFVVATSGLIIVSSIEPMLSNKNYAVIGGVIILHVFFSILVFLYFFYK